MNFFVKTTKSYHEIKTLVIEKVLQTMGSLVSQFVALEIFALTRYETKLNPETSDSLSNLESNQNYLVEIKENERDYFLNFN